MKNKQIVFAFGLILICLLGLLFLSQSPSHPVSSAGRTFKGKPVEAWVNDLIIRDDYQAVLAIKEIGVDALPYVTPNLKKKSTWANTLWATLWPKLPAPLQQKFRQPILARELRMRGVVALREIGPAAKSAVPDLLERLSDQDPQIRLHAAIALGNVGPDAKVAVADLEPFLKDKSSTVRIYSANALWKITGQIEPSLSVLEDGIKDKQAKFRWAAPVFLGEMGPAAERAIPLLEQATKDVDKEVASFAVQALAEISPKTLPIITNILSDPDPGMRISAAAALGKIGSKAKDAVPLLLTLLTDQTKGSPAIMGRAIGSEEVRESVKSALEKIDPGAAARYTGK